MKRESFPLWLLRDVPALMGMLASFWALIIFSMVSGCRPMSDDPIAKQVRDQFSLMLAHAEAKLDLAFWRQAYRRLGWNPYRVRLHIIAPTVLWSDTQERLTNYALAFRNMNRVVDTYVEDLRERYSIRKTDVVAHGSTDARLSRAAHDELVGVSTLTRAASPFALILSSARSARPSKDERGRAHARGSPLRPIKFGQTRLAGPVCENARSRPIPLSIPLHIG